MIRISHKKLIFFSKITVYLTGNHIASTYDVGFTLTENRELKLQVAVEMATNV